MDNKELFVRGLRWLGYQSPARPGRRRATSLWGTLVDAQSLPALINLDAGRGIRASFSDQPGNHNVLWDRDGGPPHIG